MRSDADLLEAVYARSRTIRARRRLARVAAVATAVMMVMAVIVAVPGDSNGRDNTVKTVDRPTPTTVTPGPDSVPVSRPSVAVPRSGARQRSRPGGVVAIPQPSGAHGGASPAPPGQIAFVSGGTIYVVNPDGTGLRSLTTTSAMEEAPPRWSPDGSRIAFVDGTVPQVWVIGRNGAGRRQVSTVDGAASDPRWSPDGTQIAFVTTRPDPTTAYVTYSLPGIGSDSDIDLVATDGTSQRPLTTGSNNDRSPVWAPSGSRIAYFSARENTDAAYTVGVNGSGEQMIWPESDNYLPSIAWSPDGGTIAVASSRRQSSDGLWLINPDGSNARRLSTASGVVAPEWAPDGSALVFADLSDDPSGAILRIVPLDGGREYTVKTRTLRASWAPDSALLTYCDVDGLRTVARDGSRSTLIVSTDTCQLPSWSP